MYPSNSTSSGAASTVSNPSVGVAKEIKSIQLIDAITIIQKENACLRELAQSLVKKLEPACNMPPTDPLLNSPMPETSSSLVSCLLSIARETEVTRNILADAYNRCVL